MDHPGLSLRANPGLKLANAFGVVEKSQTDARNESHELKSPV